MAAEIVVSDVVGEGELRGEGVRTGDARLNGGQAVPRALAADGIFVVMEMVVVDAVDMNLGDVVVGDIDEAIGDDAVTREDVVAVGNDVVIVGDSSAVNEDVVAEATVETTKLGTTKVVEVDASEGLTGTAALVVAATVATDEVVVVADVVANADSVVVG